MRGCSLRPRSPRGPRTRQTTSSSFFGLLHIRHICNEFHHGIEARARTRARTKKQFRSRKLPGQRLRSATDGGAAAWRAQWRSYASTPSWRRARGRSSPRRCAGCATALWAAASSAASPKPRAGAKIGHEATNGPRCRGLVSGADDGGISSPTRGLRPRVDSITSAVWF